MTQVVIKISGGRAEAIYSDALAPVMARMGPVSVRRASHVEPVGGDGPVRWCADMRPSNGPVLMGPAGDGFETREAALDAELAWLRDECGL